MSLACKQTGDAGCDIFDGNLHVASVRSLRLVHGLFRPDGRSFLGPEVPLQLFWMQYANHEDPERTADSHGRLSIARASGASVQIDCQSSTASGACVSTMTLSVERSSNPVRYRYRVHALLEVVDSRGWLVTPNRDHGEVEFANLWPERTFVKTPGGMKLYDACFAETTSEIFRIPHHHVESEDKHNIPLGRGDRFWWGVEEENPCVMIESAASISAGVCAYMWDAHFACKVTRGDHAVTVPQGTSFEAAYLLFGLDRDEAALLAARARPRSSEPDDPVYVNGVNRFSDTVVTRAIRPDAAWPWEREGDGLSVDRTQGVDDTCSLRINRTSDGSSLWKVTALGPAFGMPPFPEGARYCFSASVRSRALKGRATVALRLHREGSANLFDPGSYEKFVASESASGSSEWARIEVVTSPISPPPDRLHLLLMQEGVGESWFDNALLELLR
jgi:hypothetical protein